MTYQKPHKWSGNRQAQAEADAAWAKLKAANKKSRKKGGRRKKPQHDGWTQYNKGKDFPDFDYPPWESSEDDPIYLADRALEAIDSGDTPLAREILVELVRRLSGAPEAHSELT